MEKTLVIDIGGTFIKYGLIDETCVITEKGKVKTPYGSKDIFFETVQSVIDLFKNRANGVAFSAPGLIDADQGVMITAGMMQYLDGTPIIEELLKRNEGMSFSIENDGKAAALCESWIGSSKGTKSSVVLIFGSGIGGGIIINGELLRGQQLIAGEFSAMFTRFDEDNYTVLAQEASTFATVKKAQAIKNNPSIMGEEMMSLYEQGDPDIKKLVDEWFISVAKLCYNMDCLYNAECISIGGGISENPLFIQGVQKALDIVRSKGYTFRRPVVKKCEYNNDSNLIGAYYAFRKKWNL